MSQKENLQKMMGDLRAIIEFNASSHPVGTVPMQVPMPLAKALLAYVSVLEYENASLRRSVNPN